jgi:hypothetical protein
MQKLLMVHHLMCKKCYHARPIGSKLVRCGRDCNVVWKPALSPFVANVLKELPTKCQFTRNGCQVFIILKKLEVHEVDCVYRNIKCPFRNCKKGNVSFIGLDDHLEANHEDLKKTGKAKSNDIVPLPVKKPAAYFDWIPQELTFRNRSFFTEVLMGAALKNIYFWIYFHGAPEEAAHYSYRLKIIGGNGSELSFKGKVTSLDVEKKLKDVFILCDVQLEHLEVDGQINFEITLYSTKEEIKNEDVESGISEDDEQ